VNALASTTGITDLIL